MFKELWMFALVLNVFATLFWEKFGDADFKQALADFSWLGDLDIEETRRLCLRAGLDHVFKFAVNLGSAELLRLR